MGLRLVLAPLLFALCACGGSGKDDVVLDGCFEGSVTNLTTGAPVFDVVGTERATGVSATSAPNGRIVLCPAGEARGVVQIDFTGAGLLPTRAFVDVASVVAEEPLHFPVSAAEDADTLAANLGAARDPAASILTADFATPTGAGASGATLTLAGNDGSFTRSGATFAPGSAVVSDPTLLFLNQTAGADLLLAPNPPSGSECVGPDQVTLEIGGLTQAWFRCAP